MGTVKLFNHHIHKAYYWLLVAEALLFLLAFFIATGLYWLGEPNKPAALYTGAIPEAVLFATLTTLALGAMGMYQPQMREGSSGILLRAAGAFIAVMLVMSMIFYLVPRMFAWRGVFVYSLIIALAALLATRSLFDKIVNLEELKTRVLVIGAGASASSIVMSMRRKTDRQGFAFVGFVRIPGEEDAIDEQHIVPVDEPLHDYVVGNRIDRIVIAANNRRGSLPMDELLKCKLAGVTIMTPALFFEQEAAKISLEHISTGSIIFSDGFELGRVEQFVKRGFDLIASFSLLMVGWPVMLITALAIWFEDGLGAPIVYRQERVGLHGRTFEVLKMRSMRIDAERDGRAQWASQNDDRITRVGHFIRKTRIDELPQIINVLAGDMAFIGPRPERPQFVDELVEKIPFYAIRHNVKPGITGWAQLCYPYGAGVEDARQKLQYDLYYVKNGSLFLDMTIMLNTVEVVLFRKGSR